MNDPPPRLPGLSKRNVRLLLLSLTGVIVAAAYYLHSLERVAAAESSWTNALALADELRHTSDDLTRMVRTYVITGNPLYKEHFQEILDIRDGRRPRPTCLGQVYWDLVTEDGNRPCPFGPPFALLDRMRKAGIVEAEFASLQRSKVASDALTETEFKAMGLVESEPSPEARLRASQLLYDTAYHRAKAEIMGGIADFADRIEQRTQAELADARGVGRHAMVLLISATTVVAFLLGRLLFAWYQDQRLLEAAQRQQALTNKLAEAERRLRLFIEHAPAALAMFDHDMRYLAVSQRWLADYGLIGRDLSGLSHYEVFPEISEEWMEAHRRALAGETVTSEEDHFVRQDGTEHWVRWQVLPRRGADDLIGGILIFSEDITERKRLDSALEVEQKRLRNIIEGTSEGFWLIGADRRTLGVNDALCRMLGYRREELLGRSPLEFADEANQAVFREQMAKIAATDHRTYTIELRTRSGENLPTLFNATTLRDVAGAIDVAFAFVTDMRPYKEYENQLIQAKQEAEAANKAKSAFLANMSHELRTPLNSILGFAQVMERDASLPELQRSRVASIRRGGEHLLALINDILDLAKIEAGRLETLARDWETAPFFNQLREMMRPRATARDLRLEVRVSDGVPSALHCDEIRLRQVLMNLLGNAVKFTDRGGITLSAYYRDGRLYLEVADTGVGMNAEELTQVFNPFIQAGTEEKRAQGTGLGLAISRRLVEAMGGALGVESEEGRGSRFYFDIPATAVGAAVGRADKESSAHEVVGYRRLAGEGCFRLLSVDDRPENRETLKQLLEPLGFEVVEAQSGEECLALVAATTPDVVLLDLRMPHMDGNECLRRLRAIPGTERLVVIAVSASAFREEVEEAIAAGCNAHIAKPVILGELLAALDHHLSLEWLRRPPETTVTQVSPITARKLSREEHRQLMGAVKKGAVQEVQRIATALARSESPPQRAAEMADAALRFDLKRVRAILDHAEIEPPCTDALPT